MLLKSTHTEARYSYLGAKQKDVKYVACIQNQLHTTYKSLQHRVADSLPVAFELDDPAEIRQEQKRRREQLVKAQAFLETKANELRMREEKLKQNISAHMSRLAKELNLRQQAVEMQQKALEINTKQVLKLANMSLKKHSRREALIACEREAVEAKKSEYWQRDFQRMLMERPIVFAPPQEAAAAAGPPPAATKPLSETTRHVETAPADTNSFAYWLANKQYTVSRVQNTTAGPEAEPVEVADVAADRATVATLLHQPIEEVPPFEVAPVQEKEEEIPETVEAPEAANEAADETPEQPAAEEEEEAAAPEQVPEEEEVIGATDAVAEAAETEQASD
ncbi:filamin, putative [Eimeria praecox]|uniref:Filamin, putative n=1 Tax=Eimeria praecox TaxID=51316 RepID=U6GUB4_9EIME|nr:filamin, putative [Eimeria praecox]